MASEESDSVKVRTARTIKWNTIDRVFSQVAYAVVGVVLANLLSQEDFGLVGVLLIFQAFAIILTDSGFGAALLRKKNPTAQDYSTVFWFNLVVSILIYAILWICAPLIAERFHDGRLTDMAKVMFTAFVINGLSIVQTNQMMKRMDARPIAIADITGLCVSGIAGICLALKGAGAWSIVWQTVILAIVKTGMLWVGGGWRPQTGIHPESLREIWPIGASVLTSSMLNTLSLQLYNIVIGAYYKTLTSLGIYTQADKWSKMGSASISQILTASFVPLLAGVQDDAKAFRRYITRIDRFTAFILFPALGGMAAIGDPLFHTLFGDKWDAAIPLFQILCLRGIFVVLTSLHNNYLLSLGRKGSLIAVEVIKDGLMIVAILCTVWSRSLDLIVWGQFWASALTYVIVAVITSRATGYSLLQMLKNLAPFIMVAGAMWAAVWGVGHLRTFPLLRLAIEISTGAAVYFLICALLGLPELKEAFAYTTGRFRKK